MATIPEYGEEELVREREAEAAQAAHGPIPAWEDIGETEVQEHELEEERLMAPLSKDT
jgi:hypothetical protein